MPALTPGNAIAYAHFKARGGWKNILSTAGGYALVLTLVMFLFVYGMNQPPAVVFWGWTVWMLSLQALVLCLFAPSRVSVLLSPTIGNTIFTLRPGGADLDWPYVVAALFQAAFAAIFFVAAARKYRRRDLPAFGVGLGLLLLLAWVGACAVGTCWWDEF